MDSTFNRNASMKYADRCQDHPASWLRYPFSGEEANLGYVLIDNKLIPLVEDLWEVDTPTIVCCEGDDDWGIGLGYLSVPIKYAGESTFSIISQHAEIVEVEDPWEELDSITYRFYLKSKVKEVSYFNNHRNLWKVLWELIGEDKDYRINNVLAAIQWYSKQEYANLSYERLSVYPDYQDAAEEIRVIRSDYPFIDDILGSQLGELW